MKLVWSAEELVEHWSVESEDWANPDTAGEAGCLGFVAQLTFYRMWARFPDGRADFAPTVFAHLAILRDHRNPLLAHIVDELIDDEEGLAELQALLAAKQRLRPR